MVRKITIIAFSVGAAVAVVLVVAITLVVLSFRSIAEGNIGLVYRPSHPDKILNNKTYTAGQFKWAGLGNTFYLYPSVAQYVTTFPTVVTTANGTQVRFLYNWAYTLKPEELYLLFWQHGPWNSTVFSDVTRPYARSFGPKYTYDQLKNATIVAKLKEDFTSGFTAVMASVHATYNTGTLALSLDL